MIQPSKFATFRSPLFILGLLLFVFFLKGVFLSVIQPIFVGQDEARHYNTVQYISEPKDKSDFGTQKQVQEVQNKDDLSTYRFSEEIQNTSTATDTDVLRGEIFNMIDFSDSHASKNESSITDSGWKPYNYYSNPDIAGNGTSLYHKIASLIEKVFAGQSILVRFYLIRMLSVLLGVLAVFLSYLIARTVGFSSGHALLLAAFLSFQPKFSLYFTNINYDALLIPMFFLFTYGGVRTLRKGLHWKNLAIMTGAIVVAVATKPTGYILAVPFVGLVAYTLYEKMKTREKNVRYAAYGACAFVGLFVTFYLFSHFLGLDRSLGKTIGTMGDYIGKTITWGKFVLPSNTYWGTLSWTNSYALNDVVINLIFVVETVALAGIGLLLFSKKFADAYPAFLPARKYILFLIGMIVALQLGIRAADWSYSSRIGGMRWSLGTPGRYFLPNLASHVILIGTGLGAVLAYFKREGWYDALLALSLILMMSLTIYLAFDAIIFRFYL